MLGNLIREKLMAEASTKVLVAALRGETVPAPVAVEPEPQVTMNETVDAPAEEG